VLKNFAPRITEVTTTPTFRKRQKGTTLGLGSRKGYFLFTEQIVEVTAESPKPLLPDANFEITTAWKKSGEGERGNKVVFNPKTE